MLTMIARLRSYFPAVARDIISGGIILVIAAIAEVMQPWPVKWLVDHVFGTVTPSPSLHRFVPFLGRDHVDLSIIFLCASVVGLALVLKALLLISQLLLIRAGNTLVLRLRATACEHLMRLDLAYHDKTTVGDSLYRLVYDTTALQSLLSQAVAPVATGVLVLCGVTVVMLTLDPMLTVVAICAAPAYWVAIHSFGGFIGKRAKAYHDNESLLAGQATETLSSMRTVQSFAREHVVLSEFKRVASGSHTASQRLVFAQLAFSATVGLAMAAGTAAVVYLGAHRVISGRLTIGDVLVFLAYLAMLYQPMNAISQSTSVMQSVKAQLNRVFALLDTVPKIVSLPGAVAPESVDGRITFDNVSFAYDVESPVLRDVAVDIEAGQTVAIVGRTGAGKSTFAAMLLRFYDPTSGTIRLDGRDLRSLPLEWLRAQVAVVLQEPVLMAGTIGENIAYANPGATPDEIRAAATRAQANDFIESLPDGYDTVLGERGVNLSGGQRQRLGLARAFLKDAPILILDEPTSALDAHTESALVDAIAVLSRGRTTFIIAHRLSTVRLADTILVLDHGRLLEHGTHDRLMQSDSAYRRLYNTQWASAGDAGAQREEC